MAKKSVATAKSLVGLVNDLSNSQLLALTDSANRRALKKFLSSMCSLVRLVIADHFTTNNPEVRIGYIGGNFESWFGNKVEELADMALPKRHHDLVKDSLDEEILHDLGGANMAESTLAGIYEIMKLQPNGEVGELLTNGNTNIFYVKDAVGVLRAVFVTLRDDGWIVYAARVGDGEHRWFAGSRVFSCNS